MLDPTTGEIRATLNLAWPDGLQQGYSQPVAFVPDVDAQMEHTMNSAGYRYFTAPDDFRSYVDREILAVSP